MKEKIARMITIAMMVVGVIIILSSDGGPAIYRSSFETFKIAILGIIITLIGWILYPTKKGGIR